MIHKIPSLLAALQPPAGLPKTTPGQNTITEVLGFVFALAGALAFLVIIIAGLRYTLSRGNPDSVKTSKETIIYAVIGLLIAMSGYAIVTFVFGHVSPVTP